MNIFRKYMRSIAAAIVITIAVLTAMHLFISYQIRHLLPKLVTSLSKGNYRLSYQTLDFHYVQPELILTGIQLKPVGDSLETAYMVSVDTVDLSIESFIPLFLKQKEVNVDLIRLVHPVVIGKRIIGSPKNRADAALHVQIGRLQQNAIRFLHALEVNACQLIDGQFQYYPYPDQQRHFNLQHLHLIINDLVIPRAPHQMIKAEVHMVLDQPNIQIPDTSLRIRLNRFVWDNLKHHVQLDAFNVLQQQTTKQDHFTIQLDTIRIRKIDWARWLDSGIVHLDTVLTNNGQLFFTATPNLLRKKDTSASKRMKFWDAIGDLDIQHFSAKKIKVALVDNQPLQERDYSLMGDTLSINELTIRPERPTPLQVKDLALSVRSFLDKGQGNRFKTRFTKLRLVDSTIQMDEYLVVATKQSRLGEGSTLYIPHLYIKGLSLQDFFDKKARVQEIDMYNPSLTLIQRVNTKTNKPFSGFDDIRPYIDVDRLSIHDASFLIKQPGGTIRAAQISANILAHEALISTSADELLNSLHDVNLKTLNLQFPAHHLQFKKGRIDYRNKSLRFKQVQTTLLKGRIKTDLKDVAIDATPELRPLEIGQVWTFQNIDVASGSINISSKLPISTPTASSLGVRVDRMHLGDIHFSFEDVQTNAEAKLNAVNATSASFIDGLLSWDNADANGYDLKLLFPGITIRSKQFMLNSTGESVLDSAAIHVDKPGIKADVLAQQIISNEDFRSYDPDTLVFDRIVLIRPKINATLSKTTNEKQRKTFLVGSKQLEMEDPSIHLTISKDADPFHMEAIGSLVHADELYWEQVSGQTSLQIQKINTALEFIHLRSEGRDVFQAAKLQARMEKLNLHKDHPLVFDLDLFSVEDIDLARIHRGDTLIWRTKGMEMRSMNRVYLDKDSMILAAFKLPPIRIFPGTFMYHTPRSAFDMYRLNVHTEWRQLSWDSLNIFNRTPRDDYFKQFPFEKDYFTIKTGAFQANGLQPKVLNGDTVAYAQKIKIDPLFLNVERDKRMNDDTLSYRPLLAGLIKRLPVPVIIDSLELDHSQVWHNVIDEKTAKEGTIFFTDLQANVSMLKNIGITEKDSIGMYVHGKLMGEGLLDVRYKQAYLYPKQGFDLGVRLGEMSMMELNRLIVPLHNVKLDQGRIHSLAIDVTGNDSVAYGKISMNYSKLKVSVMNRAEQRRSVLSLLANLFVRGDNHRVHPILVERIKQKSVFNYWSRIALNGLLTSIGVRKNGKKTRQFFRRVEKNNRVENLF